jgi:hypothetical protein
MPQQKNIVTAVLFKHIYAPLMSAAGKISGHPGSYYFSSQTLADDSRSEAENVCIIVLPAHSGGKHFMT